MFWLLRKIFSIAIFVAIIFFGLQYSYNGRPLKDYLVDFYQAPIVKEAGRQARVAVFKYVYQSSTSEDGREALDNVTDDERKELEEILEKKLKR